MSGAMGRLRTLVAGSARIDVAASLPTWRGVVQGVAYTITTRPSADGTVVRFELGLPPWRKSLVVIGSAHVVSFDGILTTGDAVFDEQVVIASSSPSVLGCLDAAARAHLATAVGFGAYVAGGVLCCERRVTGEVESLWTSLLHVTEALRVEDTVANAALLRMSREDPDPDVRQALARYLLADGTLRELEAVRQLQEATSADDATFDLLTQRLHDPLLTRAARAEVATRLLMLFPLAKLEHTLLAAMPTLQRPLLDVLLQWVESSDAPPESYEVATRLLSKLAAYLETDGFERAANAFARCGTRGARDRSGTAFDTLVALAGRTFNDVVLSAVLRAMVAQRHHPDRIFVGLSAQQSRIERLLLRLATPHSDLGAGLLLAYFERLDARAVEQRISYVRAIATTKDTRASDVLVKHLETPYDTLQVAVIKALGAVGTLSAVAALKPYSEGFFRASELKEAAQAAIAAIRERDGARVLPGALSLADATPGGLALKEDG